MDLHTQSDEVAAAIGLAEAPVETNSGLGLITVIIPAYNEENAIVETIHDVRKTMADSPYDYELIIVDDGSEDHTGELARLEGARVVNHEMNRGYGASLKDGIRSAKGDWIVITDADSTYPADRIPDLLRHASDHDMVVGARVGSAAKIPLIRRPAKWARMFHPIRRPPSGRLRIARGSEPNLFQGWPARRCGGG